MVNFATGALIVLGGVTKLLPFDDLYVPVRHSSRDISCHRNYTCIPAPRTHLAFDGLRCLYTEMRLMLTLGSASLHVSNLSWITVMGV